MRITIESSEATTAPQAASQETAVSVMDGGAPPAGLLSEGVAEYNGQTAAPSGSLDNAGPPPSWLVDAIRRAFEQDPGRFDVQSAPAFQGESFGLLSGGPAPPAEAVLAGDGNNGGTTGSSEESSS